MRRLCRETRVSVGSYIRIACIERPTKSTIVLWGAGHCAKQYSHCFMRPKTSLCDSKRRASVNTMRSIVRR